MPPIWTRLQHRLMFPGTALRAQEITDAALRRARIERWWLDDGSGSTRVEAWLLPAERPAGALLFAHGNGELIDDWSEALRFIPDRLGHDLLLVEYPGYGRSGGRPNGTSVHHVMRQAYDRLVRLRKPRAVTGFGRSLGGGVIAALATERQLDGLVLASTFTSIHELARDLRLPGARWLENTFDTLPVVRAFAGPVLVVHGRRDELIPFRHGERLAAAARHGSLYADDGHHNDTPRDWNRFRRVLETWLNDVSRTGSS